MPRPRKTVNSVSELPIAVIGGGPAGTAAALAAVKKYKSVILYDKNPLPAKKISFAGSNTLLVAQKMSTAKFTKAYGDKEYFVSTAIGKYDHNNITKLLKSIGVETTSNGNHSILIEPKEASKLPDGFKDRAESKGVLVKKSSRVSDIEISNGIVTGIIVNGIKKPVSSVIIACGSFSAPKTGSTQDGYKFAELAGHTIIPLKPALVGIETLEKFGRLLGGVNVRDCKINVYLDDEFQFTDRGSLKFTRYGLDGEVILNNSQKIIELIGKGKIEIHIDQVPDLSKEAITYKLNEDFSVADRTTIFEHLNPLLPNGLLEVMDKIIRVHSSRPVSFLSALEKKYMMLWLKDFPFTVKRPRPFNETMGVSGGVALEDVDPQTMCSKKVSNMYFAGDVLDILGPWGGYNIETAFATGNLAGLSAAEALTAKK